MVLSVQSKILLTVLSVVLMFALFILFYYPARQERNLLENYNNEIETLAKTVALGVKIALTDENFEGVETAMNFVTNDDRLHVVSIIQHDTIWTPDKSKFNIKKSVFTSKPDSILVDPLGISDKFFIKKSANFTTPLMNGEIMLSFTTAEIIKGRRQIRLASAIASFVVFVIGFFIGYWLARKISKPVLALRDAANKVGEGDLTQSVTNNSRDEIGELSTAFNKMVKDLSTARNEITIEKQKSDELLLNILPTETAEELKRTGAAKAKQYESVSVIFTDFKDFTSISEKMSATKIVAELHFCFSNFDRIIKKNNIEKIKTIGDSYMCVAGLPVKNSTHSIDAVNAALEIRDFMRQYKRDRIAAGETFFEIRIGIHTGPVVAGIVGVDKFAYDIWGSTVNVASRLESSSEPDKINVSKDFYDKIKDHYDCTLRGNFPVKGLGEIPMYYINKQLVL